MACLIQVNPLAGLLGATAFCAVCAYTALFHTARLLLVTWTVAAAILGILGFRFAAIDPVLAVCGVLLVAVVNILAVVVCRAIPRSIDTEVLPKISTHSRACSTAPPSTRNSPRSWPPVVGRRTDIWWQR